MTEPDPQDRAWLAELFGWVGEPGTASADLITKRGHPGRPILELIEELRSLGERAALRVVEDKSSPQLRATYLEGLRFLRVYEAWANDAVARGETQQKFGLTWVFIDYGRDLRDRLASALNANGAVN